MSTVIREGPYGQPRLLSDLHHSTDRSLFFLRGQPGLEDFLFSFLMGDCKGYNRRNHGNEVTMEI